MTIDEARREALEVARAITDLNTIASAAHHAVRTATSPIDMRKAAKAYAGIANRLDEARINAEHLAEALRR